MFKKIALKSILIFLLVACADEDILPAGTQFLPNSNISEYPDSVFPWTSYKLGGTEVGVSKEVFMTGNRSLFIENQDGLNSGQATWTQTYSGPMPAPGSIVELTAFLKGVDIKNLSDGRVRIKFRVYPDSDRNGSAAEIVNLQGDFDWTLVRTTLDGFPTNAEFIIVDLIFPSTTYGRMYFDEISLTVK